MSNATNDTPQATPAWQVRPFEEGDEHKLLTLFRRTYGRDRTLADWQWKFTAGWGVGRFPHLWVAEVPDSGSIVGHYAGIPLRLRLGTREVEAMLSVETMTDPDYRRQGMLTTFGDVVYKAWAGAGQAMVIGLPNQQWGTRKEALGWVQIFPLSWLRFPLDAAAIAARSRRFKPLLRTLARPPLRAGSILWVARARLRARRASAQQRLSIEPFRGDEGVFDLIWKHAADSWTNAVVRDDKWVRWRYAECVPDPYTIHVAWRNGTPVGYVAFRVVGRGQAANGYLADIFTARNDNSAIMGLVMSALDSLAKSGAPLVMTLAVPGTNIYSMLKKLGFLPGASQQSFSFEIVPLDDTMTRQTLGGPEDWHLAGGDSDVI